MKISIVTVCYNAGSVISKTIESVNNQTYENIEYLIVDGNSKDNTLEVIKNNCKKDYKILSEDDKGIYDAMNKGIDMASGKYIIFMNAGDLFASFDVVERFVKSFKDSGLYFGDTILDYGVNKILRIESCNSFSLTKRNICHQSIFYPIDELRKIKFALKYPILSDWITNIKLYKTVKFNHLSYPVSIFSCDGVSSSSNRNKDPNFLKDLPLVCLNNLGLCHFVLVKFKLFVYEIIERLKKEMLTN